MAGNASGKGNPASHRMSNAALKARRAASYARGESRKEKRVHEQKAREIANVKRVKQGNPTPWQESCEARRLRRRARADRGMLPQQKRTKNGMIIKHLVIDGEPREVVVYCCKNCENAALVALSVEHEVNRKAQARAATKEGRAAGKAKRAATAEEKAAARKRAAEPVSGSRA